MDTGIGSADPLIVNRITTSVDVTADNTTHHPLSPPIPNANHSPWRSASQPFLARSCRIGGGSL
jgi:hypothetical protein